MATQMTVNQVIDELVKLRNAGLGDTWLWIVTPDKGTSWPCQEVCNGLKTDDGGEYWGPLVWATGDRSSVE